MRVRTRRDSGQAVVLMLAVVACIALVAIAVGEAGTILVERQRAQTAADAAALAGVDAGREAAASVATANGAVLVAFSATFGAEGTSTVTVTVRVGRAEARARASNDD